MFRCQALYFSITLTFLYIHLYLIHLANTNEIDQPLPSEKENLRATIEVLNFKATEISYGDNVTIVCKTHLHDSIMWWSYQDRNITDDNDYRMELESDNIHENGVKQAVSILHILNINLDKVGLYTCYADNGRDELDEATILLNITLAPTTKASPTVRVNLHSPVELHCLAEGYPLEDIKWFKQADPLTNDDTIEQPIIISKTEPLSDLKMNVSFKINEVARKDNGTYICSARVGNVIANSSSAILVLDTPQVTIDFVKAIGTNRIYFNWTVNDGNDPDNLKYEVQYKGTGDTTWIYTKEGIDSSARSFILEGQFSNNTEYTIRMKASNERGESTYTTSNKTRTLSEEPMFIPEVKMTGMTINSITISWAGPKGLLKDHVHYYQLRSRAEQTTEAIHLASEERNLYLFTNLSAATTYQIQVQACSEYSKQCGNWSKVVNGTTLDGISDPPVNVSVTCRFDNISHASFVFVTWNEPTLPNGNITHYNVILEGNAMFKNDQGLMENTTWGPKMTSVSANKPLSARFYNVSANTNYTISVAGVTGIKKSGKQMKMSCTMPPTVPTKQQYSKFFWRKLEEQGHWMFKLFVPRVSERNGPICCYRIYMVRMEPHQSLAELPPAEDIPVISYQEAHRTPKGGAYVAEMFASSSLQTMVFLGDEKVVTSTDSACEHCIGLRPYSTPREHSNNSVLFNSRKRRNQSTLTDPLPPYDGSLDINSNYTCFVEIIVHGEHPDQTLAAYSNYLVMMTPGPEVLAAPESNVLGLVVHVLCGLVLLALVLLTALCLLHRYTKQAHAQAVEMITFRTSFRSLRGRQRLVSLNPPDMCPIAKADLLNAYNERHRDSDYGFQQEFELLPDKFSDRTTRASDTRENLYKNRYPDIKAYDQTRVRLAQVDSIAGSDYINANFVLGYKERKKFICAQGPMDTTVNDYWRMIWEQHLELILMLTNLEEYSKTKCAKYWPDKSEGDKTFGDITVTHVEETRYSDYIIRELLICKLGTNGRESEERCITQYHYLVWKDFMAPEHPHGIIKFIKRMNEAYSLERGCILIHCSAGVGRTGTLVALDCLLQQLKEEGQAAIFNTICDLRHQRNFLVQSLKQYIFVYRALVEVAQYGDTEITAAELKATVDKLRRTTSTGNMNGDGKNGDSNSKVAQQPQQCKMEEEFEQLKNAFEDRKSCSVASGEENRDKNRNDAVLPYDRNRVILTPLPSKEHSTYINASFIEGYDNSESFIITQDPMENTVADFWRMVSEQGISVVVMLSELGDQAKKCPRYWPEDEATYEHITVRYVQAESCPYYTRREMYVRSRDGEDLRVTHLQYHGWPTVDGEVPEVTRGLIELVDHAQSCLQQQNSGTPPMVVHCGLGSHRSSLFVELSILVQQLRMERRVDIFTTTRKLRAQRQSLVNTYAQYEFLHRAIVNYAELHNLCDT